MQKCIEDPLEFLVFYQDRIYTVFWDDKGPRVIAETRIACKECELLINVAIKQHRRAALQLKLPGL